ncbi:MAG: 50S ribosomal protein L11 methyltransferase [Myxococcota bacterium]|nr:50S ribosomal protein L11 methyltransferase [Myxococcota bacterium]
MAQTYASLTVDLPEAASEECQSLLHDLGSTGLEIRDAATTLMPGMRAPAAGEAIVVAYFEDAASAQEAALALASGLPSARTRLEEVENKDWSESWKALIKSVEVGRLWVGPPWMVEGAPADKVRIVIEPKMAFGTGDHATTQLCLAATDRYLQAHPGASVLDVGTGTGVLAIAARKLGASKAVGTDNDPVSVELALENAESNGTPEVELSGKTLEELPPGKFDLVLANILANTLIELAPAITARVGDRLVLAGVLVPQHADVEAAYVACGLKPAGTEIIGEWIRIELSR